MSVKKKKKKKKKKKIEFIDIIKILCNKLYNYISNIKIKIRK